MPNDKIILDGTQVLLTPKFGILFNPRWREMTECSGLSQGLRIQWEGARPGLSFSGRLPRAAGRKRLDPADLQGVHRPWVPSILCDALHLPTQLWSRGQTEGRPSAWLGPSQEPHTHTTVVGSLAGLKIHGLFQATPPHIRALLFIHSHGTLILPA